MQFENDNKERDEPEPEKDLGGRPPALVSDERTLLQISNLASMQCTQAEAAAALGVSRVTFGKFLGKDQKARQAWDNGAENGKVSLRRYQFEMAEKNPTMAIWLGKQWLNQTDKSENTLQGPGGGPIEFSAVLGKLTGSVCPADERDSKEE